MDGTAVNLFAGVGQRQGQPPVQQAAEQKVQVGAVFFDVGDHIHKVLLVVLVRGIVNIFHVAVVQLEDAETNIQVLGGQRAFFLDFLPSTADALLADFADILVACFMGFAFFIAGFRQLYHNEFAVAAILGVELHDRVGGGGGAGEEIHNDRIFVGNHFDKIQNYINWLDIFKYANAIKQILNTLGSYIINTHHFFWN